MADEPEVQGQNEPATPVVTDADRAANPFGASRAARDDQGRFAGRTISKTETVDTGEGPRPGIPPQAIVAERRKRQESDERNARLEREVAELRGMVQSSQRPQQKPEQQAAPVFWENPDAATDYRVNNALSPVNQQLQEMKVGYSRMMAEQKHGPESVQQAIDALGDLRRTNPGEFQRLESLASNSIDPVGDVVRWHKQQRTLQEVGEDPGAYRERIKAEIMAEMNAQHEDPAVAATPAQAVAPPRLPSSFAGARSAGPRGGPEYRGPTPLPESNRLRKRG